MAEYIDKEKLIEILEQEVEEADDWKTAHEIANVAKYFPAADVRENVKGEWIEYDSGYGMAYRCSACGRTTLGAKQYDLYGNEYVYEFCPHCGTDMRGKDDPYEDLKEKNSERKSV